MSGENLSIGGESIALPAILNFAALKRAWPAIAALGAATDNVERLAAAIRIVSATLYRQRPELTAEEIEERLTPAEIPGLARALPLLLEASGLVTVSGEARPAGPITAPAASTAISTG